jgi:hypothetical protein
MKISTKIIVTSAASILGVALATGGAYAATGSLSVADAPGQVLQTSGVGPAADHASDTAKKHANEHAKGIFGTPTAIPTAAPTTVPGASADATADATANSKSAQGTASSSNTATPVPPSIASKEASTVKGNLTGKEISAWAHAKSSATSSVETVAPTAPISVGVGAHASAKAGH